MSTETTSSRKQFIVKNARLSFPYLFKARKPMENDKKKDQTPQYSADFILDKVKHAEVIAAIQAEEKRLAIEKWGKFPAKWTSALRDGSTMIDPESGESRPGYDDSKMRLSTKSQSRQHVVGRDREPITEADELIYGGCYVNVVVELFIWENEQSGKGASGNLGAVQWVRHGERFGGGTVVDPQEVFDVLRDDEDDEPAPRKTTPAKRKTPDDF